jgi:soluble lytic murein transglycosylase-like protein
LDEFGSLEAALAAYNAGPTYTRAHLKKNGGEIDMDSLWKETREYIQGIMGRIHTEKQG